MSYKWKFPAQPTKLYYVTKNGKKKIYRFNVRGQIICLRDKNKSLILKGTNISTELLLNGVDKITGIEYIRREKKWKKYNGYLFFHYFDETEKVYSKRTRKVKYKSNYDGKLFYMNYNGEDILIKGSENYPNEIKLIGKSALWGYQKIKDEEVE